MKGRHFGSGTSVVLALAAAAAAAQAQPGPQSQPTAAPAAADGPVTAHEARATAAAFARMIEDNYVDPSLAARYAAAVRAAAARGDYDRVGTASALAERLTRDAQAVAPEGHLRVRLAGTEPGPQMRRVMRRPPGAEDAPLQAMEPGPGRPIEVARWLAPGIAYIRFTLFPSEQATIDAAVKFLRDHADAETIIFDIRTHRGGGAAEMDAIFPFLFGQETALIRGETREEAALRLGMIALPAHRRVEGRPGIITQEHFTRPHPSEHRLFDARVFVLTSGFTGSAAEHFALALKGTGRGTLIGARTGGAGNFGLGGAQPLGERFTAFVPIGRSYDPRTGRGWEGTGVDPDIAVPAERALVEALVRAGVAPAEAERLSASVHPPGSMERIRPRTAG